MVVGECFSQVDDTVALADRCDEQVIHSLHLPALVQSNVLSLLLILVLLLIKRTRTELMSNAKQKHLKQLQFAQQCSVITNASIQ